MLFKMFTLAKRSQWLKKPIRCLFIGLFISTLPVYAEKIVHCIANFPINEATYTQIFQEEGLKIRVVASDLKKYHEQLLKKKGKWLWLKTLFSRSITLDDTVEKLIFFNLPPKMLKKYELSYLPKEKMVLFMWEPKTVLRGMYSPDALDCFSKIYTWDDQLVDNKRFFKFYYPVLSPMIEKIPSFKEKKLCTLIASNLKSTYPFELYSEREKVIAFFESIPESGFEFWGRRWDPNNYKSYRGQVEDKIETLKDYRFNICYENTSDAYGYITEKIFDSFQAASIPVYLGAPNITDYIPKDCFIDRRDFATLEDLYQFLKRMDQQEYEGYLEKIRAFLSSEKAHVFSQQHFNACFYEAVNGSL